MAYDAGLAARVADTLAQLNQRATRQKHVFGGRGFLVGKSTFAIVWGDELIVKTRRDDYASLSSRPGVRPFTSGDEKPMGTWLVVSSDAIADDPELAEWIERGLAALR